MDLQDTHSTNLYTLTLTHTHTHNKRHTLAQIITNTVLNNIMQIETPDSSISIKF